MTQTIESPNSSPESTPAQLAENPPSLPVPPQGPTYFLSSNQSPGSLILTERIAIFRKLSILDRLLTPAIILCMILGVIIGEFVPRIQEAFDTAQFRGVSFRT